jgi:hypothetical protein
MTKQAMTIEKVKENGISKAEQCAKEVDELLKKYNCTLVAERQILYGQQIYVPTVVEVKS